VLWLLPIIICLFLFVESFREVMQLQQWLAEARRQNNSNRQQATLHKRYISAAAGTHIYCGVCGQEGAWVVRDWCGPWSLLPVALMTSLSPGIEPVLCLHKVLPSLQARRTMTAVDTEQAPFRLMSGVADLWHADREPDARGNCQQHGLRVSSKVSGPDYLRTCSLRSLVK
jgi:hypothetical protein